MKNVNFQALLENAPGLYLILLPDLTIVAVSDAYLNATMTQRDEILGRGLFEVFPDNPDDPTADGVSNLRFSLEEVLKKKKPHAMAIQKYDIRRPDGSFEERYWSPLNKPVVNEHGDVIYIIHCVEDVTQREGAENQKKKAELLLQSSIESLKDMIILSVDCDYKYLNFNSAHKIATQAVYGIEIETGMSLLDHITNEEDRKKAKFNFDKALAGEWHTTTEEYGDVERLYFETRYNPIINEKNEVIGSTAFAVNITNRKKAEEDLLRMNGFLDSMNTRLEDANRELEAFSYSVSHDLKAPLRSLQGFSKALLENYKGKFDENAERWLHFIEDNANRMGLLIDDILAFSKISRLETNKSLVDMRSLAKEVFDELEIHYPNKKVLFDLSDIPSVSGDLMMLRQVWHNLISNALKYSSKQNTIHIHINWKKEKNHLIYHVSDNGVGFNPKYANKLFKVFQRLHGNEEFEGTGVGLAIVHRIIQKHNGWIKASAKLGKGSKFSFAIPVNQ